LKRIAKKDELLLRVSGERPHNFRGTVRLPPSKSYIHRALFVSSLCSNRSTISNCYDAGGNLSEDARASVNALTHFGVGIKRGKLHDELVVDPGEISSGGEIFAGGSGTTARFAIAYAAIPTDGGSTTITGDSSLLKRPMKPLLDALSQLGVSCISKNSGKLPVVVEGSGIAGGSCTIDSSASSQFLSALLIACTRARKQDTTIIIDDTSPSVSVPYVEATMFVLRHFGFVVARKREKENIVFKVKRNQRGRQGGTFSVPGDMSSAASLIAATVAAKGRARLTGVDLRMPQADSSFLDIVKRFGAKVVAKKTDQSIIVDAGDGNERQRSSRILATFDLQNSPDLVPVLAGLAVATGLNVGIRGVHHLRFKESDRLQALYGELGKMEGVKVDTGKDSLSIRAKDDTISGKEGRKASKVVLDSHNDHRILMGLTIAGISGRFGELFITNPLCVAKSYPCFISDLKYLAHGDVVSITKREEK
jgi:3-phosphoshikimate 1-carboxyvinyltransferase